MKKFTGQIRFISQLDLPATKQVLAAWLTSDEVAHYFEFIENSLNRTTESLAFDSNYLVAETVDREVVGVLGYRKPITKMLKFATTKNPAELNMLYVLPEKRGGQGVGTALVTEMEKILKRNKYTEVLVRSAKRFKKTAWGFYDQLPGFQRISVLQETDNSEPAQIWQKIIN